MSAQDQISNLLVTMEDLESDMGERIEQTRRRSERVSRLIYSLITIMGALALLNIYFVNDVTQEVRLVIRHMNEMYGHAGRVSNLMSNIRSTVKKMELKMNMLPIMDEQMAALKGETRKMRGSVSDMNSTIRILDHQVGAMNVSVWDMSMRLRNLNSTVGNMGRDVYQFARPVR